MSRSLPGWLVVLIGLILIVVVGSAVLFYVRARQPAGVNPSAAAPPGHASSPARTTGTSNTTVFLIVMENHNWSAIKNNPSAPYINQTLLPMASYTQ